MANDEARHDGRLRAFVVDDHPSFLRAVEAVLDAAGFDVVGTASTGEAAVDALCARDDVDLALVDVHLPGISGIEVARRYAECRPRAPGVATVVLMSTTDIADLPGGSLGDGVAGFLLKDALSTSSLRSLAGRSDP